MGAKVKARPRRDRALRHGDRVVRRGVTAKVVDVHEDKEHISVLPDEPLLPPRQLVRWDVAEVERAT